MALADHDSAAVIAVADDRFVIRPRALERVAFAVGVAVAALLAAAFTFSQHTETFTCTPPPPTTAPLALGAMPPQGTCDFTLGSDWRLLLAFGVVAGAAAVALAVVARRLAMRVVVGPDAIVRREALRRVRFPWAAVEEIAARDRTLGRVPTMAVRVGGRWHLLHTADATTRERADAIVRRLAEVAARHDVRCTATLDSLLIGGRGATRLGVRFHDGRSTVRYPFQTAWSFVVWLLPVVPAMIATDGFNLWTRPDDRAGLPARQAYLVVVLLAVGTVLVQVRVAIHGLTMTDTTVRIRHLVYTETFPWRAVRRIDRSVFVDRAGTAWAYLKFRAPRWGRSVWPSRTLNDVRAAAVVAAVRRHARPELVAPIRPDRLLARRRARLGDADVMQGW